MCRSSYPGISQAQRGGDWERSDSEGVSSYDSKASDLRADGPTGWSTTEWDREVVDELRFISPLLLIISIDGPRESDRGRCPV